ncbi:uncharacterized protein LOC114132391 [Aphis gossypii]|uniref:Uncharacterized protein n=1 Tax=Aphis gossypii TaxID=80765 RepID=A0A9P0JEQ0_APHGO|nr:uncharacterized protein LOC114132391 [Aphis gossypii]XP_050060655.1 uncharacterized protein LOC114132391 [Aphis gossypii]XP_050060656.1 uncharacterized protein LOC114132391 [Aphis gossypii]XP_050060657.1 uncharacterized protein LOC114132391 [Aphis gossypii]CAH1738199.1 unnamed protein product [Aphis gossypii]
MQRVYCMVFVLIMCISFAFAADNLSKNWSSDDDTLPEVLPKKMRDKSDDEIQKAVFQAYENQLKVISEYNGHMLDPESPYGFFKDEMPISNARTSNPQSDLIFYNNAIRGFIGHNKNSIIIKWVPNQVVTELGWKEMSVRGRYTFINSTYFDQGKYHVQLQDLKYLASTTLSENTESYPSTVPKSSISYKSVKVSFTGGLPEVLKISDSSNVKHFIEDIVFQQVADRVVRDTHNNITVAIRQVIKPYIIFKNDTDPNFPGTNGKLPSGSVGYTISNTVISGFANAEHKLKKITTKMATNIVTADLRITIHSLDGKFDFKLEESKPTIGKATFAVSRIDVNVSFNMLKPVECKAEVVVNQPNVKYGTKLSADIEKTLTNAFIDNVKIQLNTNICKALGQMIKPGK